MKDYVIRAMTEGGEMRAFFADTTELVEKARNLHNTTKVATAALGRTLTATSIMGLMMKNLGDKLTVILKGGGPIGTILVTSDAKGIVKGYVTNPGVEVEDYPNGKLNVAGAVGNDGFLKVIKDFGLKEPYNGSYPILSGEIAEDFTNYLAMSEQTPSVVALGVLTTVDEVIHSGGFIIQLMPESTDESITKLEENLKELPSVTQMMQDGFTPEDMLAKVLDGFNPRVLEKDEIAFECDCSRERMEQALISLGTKHLTEMIEEDHGAEIGCQFCNKKYDFTEDELQEMVDNL
ncbi:MAG: Hsp33 family molecular chaperone HslO [Clostridioides sp.]|jgi:molecular chaperone Hsp33|nr:Hsp33 family molecular chaperone HslO [Clostridioides sp.]